MIDSFKAEIKNLIAKDELKKALDLLMQSINDDSELMTAIVIKAGAFKRTKKQFHAGVLSDQEFSVKKNKMMNAVLFLLEEIENEDLHGYDHATDILHNAIKALPFRSVGKVHLVNCDRIQAFKKYTTFFRPRQSLPHQFYFCAGCPTQKPASFAERLIYEIIDDVLIDDESAIEYERIMIDIKGSMVERLRFHPLPVGIDKHASILKFQKYFGQRLQHLGLDRCSIDDFIAKQGIILPYKYFVFAFEIEVDDWDDELLDYLHWIVDTFRKAKKASSCHLFFFVINMPKSNHQLNEKVINDINQLIEKSADDCLLLTDYHPVPQDEVMKWFRRTNNNANPNQLKEIIRFFEQNLIQQNRWDGQSNYNMMDVEELQELVYHIYLKHYEKVFL